MLKFNSLKVECQKNTVTNKETRKKVESYIIFPGNEYNTLIINDYCDLVLKGSNSEKSILDEFLQCDDYEDFFNKYGFLLSFNLINTKHDEESRNFFEVKKEDIDIIKKRLIFTRTILTYYFEYYYHHYYIDDLDAIDAILQLLHHENQVMIDEFNYCSSEFLIKDCQTAFIFSSKNKDTISKNLYNAYTEKFDEFTEEQQICLEFLCNACFKDSRFKDNVLTRKKPNYFGNISQSLYSESSTKEAMKIIIYHEINHNIKYSSISIRNNDSLSLDTEFNSLLGIMYYTMLKQAKGEHPKRKCANPCCKNLINLERSNCNKKYCSDRCKNLINQRNYQARKRNEKNK